MGVPLFEIRHMVKEHNIKLYSSNYTLYGDISDRVFHTLNRFTPDIERYSIDEAFLLFKGFSYVNIEEYARIIRNTTTRNTGIPITIGLAATKTLAKVASKKGKKYPGSGGVKALFSQADIDMALSDFPVGDLWGIGRRYEKKLTDFGIRTAAQFIKLNPKWVQRNMTVTGLRMWHELRGKSCIPLDDQPANKKGMCSSRSFGSLITDYKVISNAVSEYSSIVARKLREENTCCKHLRVFLGTHPFRDDLPQYHASYGINLKVATNSTVELVRNAERILNKIIYKPGYKYYRAGVMISDIIPADQIQTYLFDEVDIETSVREAKLMKIMDSVNKIYGRDMVRVANLGYGKEHKLKAVNLSPCYTTRIKDVFEIKV
jgi:DNA polymerase V